MKQRSKTTKCIFFSLQTFRKNILYFAENHNFFCLIFVYRRTWITEAELRQDKHGPVLYHYAISLGGGLHHSDLPSTVFPKCSGKNTAVCQYKPRDSFARKIAEISSNSPSYVMAGKLLAVLFSSTQSRARLFYFYEFILSVLTTSNYFLVNYAWNA